MDKKMIIQGCPVAWVFLLNIGTGSADDTVTDLWFFDNLNDASAKKLKSGSSTTSGEKTEFTRSDGAKIQFDKESLTIDGSDESQIATDTGGADASGEAEMTLIVNEAPTQAGIESMTEFEADVIANINNKMLIVMPTGYSYNRLGQTTVRKPDGFAYMFGKLTSDIEIKNNAPNPFTMTYASQKANLDKTSIDFTGKGIAVKRGGAGYDVAATYNVPLSLDSTDIAALNEGKIVIKPNV